jgi:hypothetical protein
MSIDQSSNIDLEPHGRRRGRRRSRLSMIAVVVLIIGGVIVGHGDAQANAVTMSTVPEITCPTEFGATTSTNAAKIPHFARVDLSPALAVSLAVYTDLARYQSVLGPRGWRCKAFYGADGNGGVTIYPTSASIGFSGVFLVNNKNLQAINVDWNPACVECILNQACPFFFSAKSLYSRFGYPDGDSNCELPKGEVLLRTSNSLDYFSDPPGIKGTATPSGGRLRALGIVYWGGPLKLKHNYTGTNGSVTVSCTLSLHLKKICQESFSYFEGHDDFKLINK